MTYATGLAEFIDACNDAMPPDFHTYPLEDQRALYLGLTKVFHYDLPGGVQIADHVLEAQGRDLTMRSYVPESRRGRGLVVYIRGGGFVVGSLDTHNTVVAELALKTGLCTVALDFRLAPEHPFPAGLEDCYDQLVAVTENPARFGLDIDPSRVVISGDSSGANMAVALAMMCRDRNGPELRAQALISPVLDFTRWRHGGESAPLLTGDEMEYYTACLCPDAAQAEHPYVSPLVSGEFDDLPPAYIMGAELDSLRVDGETYARRLEEHGIAVTHTVEPGLVHSAVRARGWCAQVSDAWDRFCAAVAEQAEGE